MTLSFLLLPQQVAANEATPTHIKNSKIFNPTQPQTSNMSSSNQTSNTSTNFIKPSLSSNPKSNLYAWKKSAHSFARTLMADHDPYGLTSHLVDDQTWEALRENNLPDPDPHAGPGAMVVRPRPVYAAPAPLQAGMTRLALLRWKEDKTKHADFLKASSELRHALLQSIGAHNTMTLERAVGDIMDVQPMEIYANMIAQHGVFTTTDIEALEVKLLKPLSSLSNFEPHCAAFRLNLQSLDREQAMPIPQTVYKIFKQTLKNFPQFSPYQPHFDIAFPQREDRLFEDYYHFIQPHLPTISASTSSNPFAGSAQQKSSTNTVSKSDFDALKS